MPEVWSRIVQEAAKRPGAAGRVESWLAENLGCSLQTLDHWKKRGVPAKRHQQIAALFGWSVEALMGDAPPPASTAWPFETVPRERFDALSERQKGVLEAAILEKIAELEGASSKRYGTHG